MLTQKTILTLGAAVFTLASFTTEPGAILEPSIPSLKDAFKKDFAIGTALNTAQIDERNLKTTEFIARQFNMATPENVMKSALLHPKWDTYTFEMGDKLIEFGKKHNIKINGHTLIWHSQLPAFVRGIHSQDSIRTFFTDHINTVAGHYKGKVFSWDVVNEALNEDGTLRKSVFLQHLGDNYVTEAFRLAQAASPNTELYYNDYNNEQPAKRAGCIALIKKVKEAGVRIDGVGIQGHWHVGRVPLKDIEESIVQYAALGLKVMFTELDLEVLPRNFQGADVGQRMASNATTNPYPNALPDSVQQQLATDYESLFKLFLKHKDKVTRVTFWGVNDGDSWLNNWPIRGRTSYPLLFDRNNQPKPAFYKVVALAK
jgi:endo-1,4-beta-xylanase